jgi:ASC-1-like (ASCH) protein
VVYLLSDQVWKGNFTVIMLDDVISELEEAYLDIPFENSDFQNRAFVMAAQQSVARGYRAVGLRMFEKIRAIKKHLLEKERKQIQKAAINAQLDDSSSDLSEFERRQLEVDLKELSLDDSWDAKLLHDAMQEITCLYSEFKKMPRYTREQFEQEEEAHFTEALQRALKVQGHGEKLLNITHDLKNWEERINLALQSIEQ